MSLIYAKVLRNLKNITSPRLSISCGKRNFQISKSVIGKFPFQFASMALIFTSNRIIYQREPRDKNIKRLRTLYISGIFDKTFYFMYQSRTVIQAKVRNHEIFHEGITKGIRNVKFVLFFNLILIRVFCKFRDYQYNPCIGQNKPILSFFKLII